MYSSFYARGRILNPVIIVLQVFAAPENVMLLKSARSRAALVENSISDSHCEKCSLICLNYSLCHFAPKYVDVFINLQRVKTIVKVCVISPSIE